MYEPSERANIFDWYLLGPPIGPTIGPFLGGVIMHSLAWSWIFWVMAIICAVNVSLGFIFLEETYVPVLVEQRKKELE
jgi:MFS family permease